MSAFFSILLVLAVFVLLIWVHRWLGEPGRIAERNRRIAKLWSEKQKLNNWLELEDMGSPVAAIWRDRIRNIDMELQELGVTV